MTTAEQTFAIVGASLAGAKAAEELRAGGFDGRVVLIGEEPLRPYERPPLSKGYLRGEADFDAAAVHDADFYEEQGIELLTSTTATSLDLSARELILSRGGTLRYDRLLLATGASPRRLSLPGADLRGVHYLRSLADADALRLALSSATRLVVVGAGWIGSEVAASARQLGKEVALVETAAVPLERVLGPEVGAMFAELHRDNGVELHLGAGVEALRGDGDFAAVALADGTLVEGDLVVVGVGASPRLELAERAGLTIENGIRTDEFLATSAPGVFAAGDVASAFHPLLGGNIRLEHWFAALHQGPVAARNMLGRREAYARVPYFFSDQYDLGMEYSGYAREWDQIVYRGDRERREVIVFWLLRGSVVAGMNVNVWDVADRIAELVLSPASVDVERLADGDVPLAELIA